jgi:polyhydroxybutyrate depolymerase
MLNLLAKKTAPFAPLAAAVLLLGLAAAATVARASVAETYGGRQMIVHVPDRLPPAGSRALVVVLHGGLGNADRIANHGSGVKAERGMNMDAVADANGFVVAYLNGTPVTRVLGDRFLGWNAGGGCCGQSAANNVDDVAYIEGAVSFLAARYGIDRSRVYGLGHSNGAMMTQRLVCETRLYAAAVAVSGPLNLETSHCPSANGARVLAIHGADDRNVPVTGGRGEIGLSGVVFSSEDRSSRVMTESGAAYTLQILPGVDHALDHIDAAIAHAEGLTLAQKAAQFFGLTRSAP